MNHFKFQVKKTQTRRYLVEPNRGLIAPGSSETILLSTHDMLGQSGLDQFKDEVLVQSCTVDKSFAAKKSGSQAELYDALTAHWKSVTSGGTSAALQNKKIDVRHIVDPSSNIHPPPSVATTIIYLSGDVPNHPGYMVAIDDLRLFGEVTINTLSGTSFAVLHTLNQKYKDI